MIHKHFNEEKSQSSNTKERRQLLRNGWTEGASEMPTAVSQVSRMARDSKSAQNHRIKLVSDDQPYIELKK